MTQHWILLFHCNKVRKEYIYAFEGRREIQGKEKAKVTLTFSKLKNDIANETLNHSVNQVS